VGTDLAQRVIAEQPCLDLDAGEQEPLCREARDLFVAKLRTDGLISKVYAEKLLASTMPLRSTTSPRLGTIGSTAMRLASARVASSSNL
jgi:hypothetical protein